VNTANTLDQTREVAVKFARDATNLIERGKASDVCARKLVAAAVVMHGRLGGEAEISEMLRDEVNAHALENMRLARLVEDLTAERNSLKNERELNGHNQSVTLKP
jgi:hypothetical protein